MDSKIERDLKLMKGYIYDMDDMIGRWLDGEIAEVADMNGEDVYSYADELRDNALACLERIRKAVKA